MLRRHWFEAPRPLRLLSIYYQAPDVGRCIGLVRRPFWTLQINLTTEVEALFDKMHKSNRNEVRRAEKEGVTCNTCEDIAAGVAFYNQFADSRNLPRISVERVRGRGLLLTEAIHEGRRISIHVYVVHQGSGTARLLNSATMTTPGITASFAGFANRALHWWDIQYFKRRGFTTYDLGGIAHGTSDPQLLGINSFKERLGGDLLQCFHYYGFFAWILYEIREVVQRVKR